MEMLDTNHYLVNQLVNELQQNAQMKHVFDLIECLKPALSIENGMYHYKLNDAKIDASGDTVYAAMMDFNSKIYSQTINL